MNDADRKLLTDKTPICKIGIFRSWAWDKNTISHIETCCNEIGEELMGVHRCYEIHRYHYELLGKKTKEQFRYCRHCGGKIEFYESHKRYDEWRDNYVLKLSYTSLIGFTSCCEGLATACKEGWVVFSSGILRLKEQPILFCFSCGKELAIVKEAP